MEKPFSDRTKERLGTADLAIISARQMLLEAAKVVGKGEQPKGVDPVTYAKHKGL